MCGSTWSPVQADVPRGMAGRPDDAEVEAAARDLFAPVEGAVRVGDLDPIHHARAAAIQAIELVGRRAVHAQPLAHFAEQLVGVDIARLDEQSLQPMKAQVGVGDLAQPTRQTVMIGVDVRDDQVPNIRHPNVKRAQMALERAQRVGGVPAAIDQHVAVVRAHQVRVDVPQRAITERQRQPPYAGQQLGSGRYRLGLRRRVIDRLRLRHPG